MRSSSRIMLNAAATYLRMLVVALSGFVAVPIAIRSMGASDYGIFSVIAGSMVLILFISGALAQGIERNVAFAMGEGDTEKVINFMSAGVLVQWGWGLLLIVVGVSLRSWILHHGLSIPADRMHSAYVVFDIVLFVVVLGIMQTPFYALLMAHEDIFIQSIACIVGALVFLVGVAMLPHAHGDRLVRFTFFFELNQALIFMTTIVFSVMAYPEARSISFSRLIKPQVREILGFSVWNSVMILANFMRVQGPSVVLNRMFGTVINASYGIAAQVNGSLFNLSTALYRATFPQIVKSRAAGRHGRMEMLACACCKYSSLLLWVFLSPIIFNVEFILHLWLHTVPQYAPVFVTGVMVMVIIDQFTAGYIAVMQAVGKLAVYQVTIGLLTITGLFVGYALLRISASPNAVAWGSVCAAMLAGTGQLVFAKRLGQVSLKQWSKVVLGPLTVILSLGTGVGELLRHHLRPSIGSVALTFVCEVVLAISVFVISSSKREREMLIPIVKGLIVRRGGTEEAEVTGVGTFEV